MLLSELTLDVVAAEHTPVVVVDHENVEYLEICESSDVVEVLPFPCRLQLQMSDEYRVSNDDQELVPDLYKGCCFQQ